MKQTKENQSHSSNTSPQEVVASELTQLKKELGHTPTSLETLLYSTYRSTVFPHLFTTSNHTQFAIDLSSASRYLPHAISKSTHPVAQFHSIHVNPLESSNTQQHLKNTLTNIGKDTSNTNVSIVDGKINFVKEELTAPIKQTFTLEEHNPAQIEQISAGDLIFLLTNDTPEQLRSTANSVSQEAGVVSVLPLQDSSIAGSLCHWAIQHETGVLLEMNKLTTINPEYTKSLSQAIELGLILIVKSAHTETITTIIDHYAKQLLQLGNVSAEKTIQLQKDTEILANIPLSAFLTSKNTEPLPPNTITHKEEAPFLVDSVPFPSDLKEVAIQLLKHPNIASLKNVVEKEGYVPNARTTSLVQAADTMFYKAVELNDVISLAAISLIDSNSEHLNQRSIRTIAQLIRKTYCSGATPKALVGKLQSCENEATFSRTYSDIKNMCRTLGLSEQNLSYSLQPTATNTSIHSFGVVGELKGGDHIMTTGFKHKGDLIFIIGENNENLSGSEYLSTFHKQTEHALPQLDLTKEVLLIHTIQRLIQAKLINAAHSCGKGGLFIALTEMAIPNELGFDIVSDAEIREDAFLFAENPGRVVVTVNEDQEDDFLEYMMESGISYTLLGHVTKGKLVVDDDHYGFIQEAKDIYEHALGNLIEK